jgi:hypothetical protein
MIAELPGLQGRCAPSWIHDQHLDAITWGHVGSLGAIAHIVEMTQNF